MGVVRSDLPTGTVTFLFTDVEGSTRLLHELGPDRYAEALAEHRRVLREAFAAHGGVEVDTQGDAFFYGFPTAGGLTRLFQGISRRAFVPTSRGRVCRAPGTRPKADARRRRSRSRLISELLDR